MNCPKCGKKTRVIKTEKYDGLVKRIRFCDSCKTGFTSSEIADKK